MLHHSHPRRTSHLLLQIREVVKMAPAWRQTMLFSATMTEEVKKLVALSLNHPVRCVCVCVCVVRGTHLPRPSARDDPRLRCRVLRRRRDGQLTVVQPLVLPARPCPPSTLLRVPCPLPCLL